ncbi:olfactory receptor 10A4-like [Carettochelys insculpta]|uniref:olfactory receptor 10A4-like n=1 Tax=Carettochelys insculpta TaxID=44489 RepID=UPI003EB8BFBD
MTYSESDPRGNQTISNVLILVGFSYLNELQILLFVVLLVIYLVTLMGNLFVIVLIKLNPCLHTPMYFFLLNLSFLDICFTSGVIPKLLFHLLVEEKTISIVGCAAQMYVVTIMGVSWFIGISVEVSNAMWIFSLPFCGSNRIHHYYCDIPPIVKLLCTNARKIRIFGVSVSVLFILCPFLLIILSYLFIINSILKLPSAEGRHKTFSTCSTHLIVVSLFYGLALITFLMPKSSSTSESDQVISLLNIIVPPALNPILYTLRNKGVKEAFRKTIEKSLFAWS